MNIFQPGVTVLTDDAACKALLVNHGREVGLEKAKTWNQQRSFCVWASGHHIYCVVQYRDYPDPADNGFAAYIIDRAMIDAAKANQIINSILDTGRDETCTPISGYVELPPPEAN